MATGFLVSGRGDLDSLFMARVNAARANVGFITAGADLAQRYEPIGSGTPIAATGFWQSGVGDLASLFRNISEPLGPTFPISNQTSSSTMSGVNASASYALRNDGEVFAMQGNNTAVDIGDWINPKSGMSGYSVMATLVSGSLDVGSSALATWLNLGTTRLWLINQNTVGTKTAQFSIQIRRDSDSVVVKSGVTITLNATRAS